MQGWQTPPIETALMTPKPNSNALKTFPRRHLLTCEGLSANEINFLLDLADKAADHIRQNGKKRDVLAGRTLINLFFESSTRTQSLLRNGRQAAQRRRHEHERRDVLGHEGRDADRHRR